MERTRADVGETTQQDALTRAIQTRRGDWDPPRAVAALREAGYAGQEKWVREVMRRLAKAGVIVRVHPTRAVYRLAADAETAD